MAKVKSVSELNDYELKKQCVGGVFGAYVNNCTVTLSPVSAVEISDEMINDFECILNRESFGRLSEDEQFKIFDNFSQEMADYVGVEKADLKLCHMNNLQSYLSGFEFVQIGKFMGKEERMKFLIANLDNGEYAFSQLNNNLTFYYYSNQYYSQVKRRYKLNDKELQEVMTDDAIVSSMRHEYQHFFQFAKIKNCLTGQGDVEERYKIMALYSIMKLSLMDYKNVNGVKNIDDSNLSYFTDPFEVDARLSELSFIKKLICDERVSKETKDRLKKFATYYINYNFKFEDKVKFSKLVEQNIKNTKANFKKLFGEVPIAQEILNAFEMCNLDRFYVSIDRQKDMCIKAFEQYGNKEICKEL